MWLRVPTPTGSTFINAQYLSSIEISGGTLHSVVSVTDFVGRTYELRRGSEADMVAFVSALLGDAQVLELTDR